MQLKTNHYLMTDFNNCSGQTHANSSTTWQCFKRDFRSDIRKLLIGVATIHSVNYGHWYITMFVKLENSDKLVYISISDVRHFKNEWFSNILFRTAKHDKDWTGGGNRYTNLKSLAENIDRIKYLNW